MNKMLTALVYNEYPSYRGGDTLYDGQYVWEYCAEHHLRNKWGWVPQAWLVAEDKLGRPLHRDSDPQLTEVVHHVDECKTNNHPDNLEVMTRIEHVRHHMQKLGEKSKLPLTELQVAKALLQTNGSLDKAAKLLHCSSMTLRNRFPDAISPYLRTRPFHDYHNKELVAKVLVWAETPTMKATDIDWSVPLSLETVRRICRKNGICWKRRSKKGEVKKVWKGRPTCKDPRTIEAVRDYLLQGQSVESIACRLHFRPDSIKTLCRKNGISYPKKPTKPPKNLKWKVFVKAGKMTLSHPDAVDYIRKKVALKIPLSEIAFHLKHTESSIRGVCRREGILYPKRKGGRRKKSNPLR